MDDCTEYSGSSELDSSLLSFDRLSIDGIDKKDETMHDVHYHVEARLASARLFSSGISIGRLEFGSY